MEAAKATSLGPLKLLLEVPAGLLLHLGLLGVHLLGGLGPGGLLGLGLVLHFCNCLLGLVGERLDLLGNPNMEDQFIKPATDNQVTYTTY